MHNGTARRKISHSHARFKLKDFPYTPNRLHFRGFDQMKSKKTSQSPHLLALAVAAAAKIFIRIEDPEAGARVHDPYVEHGIGNS